MSNITNDLFTLTAIFESLEDAVLSHDTDHIILQWNPAAEAIFGFTAAEIIGQSIFKIIPSTYHQKYLELFNEVQAGKKIVNFRSYRIKKSLEEFPVSLTLSPIKDEEGKIIGASHIISDITDVIKSEEKQAILSSIIETSEDAIISKSLNGKITSWNIGAERMFGYTAEEAIGQPITILIAKDRLYEEDYILSCIKNGERIQHYQTIRMSKTGKEIPISLTVSPIKDKLGNTIGISKIARNISNEKQAAEKQAFLAAIVESSDDAIISKNLDGMILSWNTGAQKIFGYNEEEVIGKHISILIPPYRLDEETSIISSIKRGETVDHFQTTRLNKVGEEIDISLTISPIKDSYGNIIGASKIARNITLQKEAEESLLRNNNRLKILNRFGRTIYRELDVNAIVQKVADATTQISGANFGCFFYFTEDENHENQMLFKTSGFSNEDLAISENKIKSLPVFSSKEVVRVDDITNDPRTEFNELSSINNKTLNKISSYLSVPVKSAAGNVIGGLFFIHQKTGVFKQEHEELIVNLTSQAAFALENSKLFEEVKELSRKKDDFIAMASHELKTPLTSLSGFMQILNKKVNEAPLKVFVGKSINMLDKLSVLINDLLDISKIKAGKLQFHFEHLDIAYLTADISENLNASQSTHQVNFNYQDPVFIMGDRLRLEQALVNLISNAIKYSPQANKVDINIENNSDKVIVIIKDYGMGISKEDQKKIFSQFYRVEEHSNKISGLGMGLFITMEIAERHGGKIKVESELKKGSTFSIELPVNQNLKKLNI
jgi:PAS domain S-box-containing protein